MTYDPYGQLGQHIEEQAMRQWPLILDAAHPYAQLPRHLEFLRPGRKVVYVGCSDDQAHGYQVSFDDPRPHLHVGETYSIARVCIEAWSTAVFPEGFTELKYGFNSVCFEAIHDAS